MTGVDVIAPVEDGTRIRLADGNIAYIDIQTIQTIQDSGNFYIPLSVVLREEFTEVVTVDEDFIATAPNEAYQEAYNVTYDTLVLSNNDGQLNHGFWFGTVENLNLNINATADIRDDVVDMTNSKFVENLTINTGAGDDFLTLNTTGLIGDLNVNTGAGDDEINVTAVDASGNISINSDAGGDVISLETSGTIGIVTVSAGDDQDTINITQLGDVESMTLSGGANSDSYQLNLHDVVSGDIIIDDITSTDLNSAGNTLVINTDSEADVDDNFLFRNNLVYMHNDDAGQRISYTGVSFLDLYSFDGNDSFVFDNNNIAINVFAGNGDDRFQVGQMYQSPRGDNSGLSVDDYSNFNTTLTSDGYLSDGSNEQVTLSGGAGEDSFVVFRNLAELNLLGGDDNDSFLVRSFIEVDPNDPDKPFTNINGGQGADAISYALNAPVNIEGGDGLDTLTVLGTEFGDDYIIDDEGIYGAGRVTRFNGIEQIIVDGMEGNDTFFIFSTPDGVDLQVIGGLGSDTFNIAGGNEGKAIDVVANDLLGHSGLVTHTGQGDIVNTLALNVMDNDEAGVRIMPLQDSFTVIEGISTIQYAVALTRPPKNFVTFEAKATSLDERNIQGSEGLLLNGNEDGATLIFDRSNWFKQQIITITAKDESITEQNIAYNIQHKVSEGFEDDGDAYDGIPVESYTVEVIDAQTPSVVLIPNSHELIAAESGEWDAGYNSYDIVLSKAPTSDVVINISDAAGQLTTVPASIIFSSDPTAVNAWNNPQTVIIDAVNENNGVIEGIHFSRLTHSIVTDDADYKIILADSLDVKIGDSEISQFIVLENGPNTTVTEQSTTATITEGQVLSVSGNTFIGTIGTSTINETGRNNSFDTAQDLDVSSWSQQNDAEIIDSATIPHISINATLEGTKDYYTFEVTNKMIKDGPVSINLDIDHGFEYNYDNGVFKSDPVYWLSELNLFKQEANGNVLQTGVSVNGADEGSAHNSYYDDKISYSNITAEGTYVIEVGSRYSWYYDYSVGQYKYGVPEGADYTLHVSAQNHEFSELKFTPDPVLENEEEQSANNQIQDIDGESGWYTFEDLSISNGLLDDSTPHTVILGSGNGTVDRYQFKVSTDMLNPVAGTTSSNSLIDGHVWYDAATISLSASHVITTGELWTVTINGEIYEYSAAVADDIDDIALGLRDSYINDTRSSDDDVVVTVINNALTLVSETGFGFTIGDRGLLSGGVTTTPDLVIGNTLTNSYSQQESKRFGSNIVKYSETILTITGDVNANSTWAILVDGAEVAKFSAGANNVNLNAALNDLATDSAFITADTTNGSLTVTPNALASVAFVVTGNSNGIDANIEAIVQQNVPIIANSLSVTLDGDVSYIDDTWTLTINDANVPGNITTFTHTSTSIESIRDVAIALKDKINTTTTVSDGIDANSATVSATGSIISFNTDYTGANSNNTSISYAVTRANEIETTSIDNSDGIDSHIVSQSIELANFTSGETWNIKDGTNDLLSTTFVAGSDGDTDIPTLIQKLVVLDKSSDKYTLTASGTKLIIELSTDDVSASLDISAEVVAVPVKTTLTITAGTTTAAATLDLSDVKINDILEFSLNAGTGATNESISIAFTSYADLTTLISNMPGTPAYADDGYTATMSGDKLNIIFNDGAAKAVTISAATFTNATVYGTASTVVASETKTSTLLVDDTRTLVTGETWAIYDGTTKLAKYDIADASALDYSSLMSNLTSTLTQAGYSINYNAGKIHITIDNTITSTPNFSLQITKATIGEVTNAVASACRRYYFR